MALPLLLCQYSELLSGSGIVSPTVHLYFFFFFFFFFLLLFFNDGVLVLVWIYSAFMMFRQNVFCTDITFMVDWA